MAISHLSGRTALLMTVSPLLWAANAVVGRLMVGLVSPMLLNLVRWVLAALILLPLGAGVFRRGHDVRRSAPYLLLVGSLGVGTYNALQYLALETSTPINVTLIAASMPVWMLAVGALCFDATPSRPQLLGAALSVAGVLLVVARGDLGALARVQLVRGDLYVVGAVIAWAFYSWLLVRPPAALLGGEPPVWTWAELLLLQVLFGLLLAGGAATVEAALGHATLVASPRVLAAIVFVAVGPAVIAYRCWGLGVATGGPSLAALFSNLTPLFAALLSAAVLHQPPRWFHAVAFALIVAGILVPARVEATTRVAPTRAPDVRRSRS